MDYINELRFQQTFWTCTFLWSTWAVVHARTWSCEIWGAQMSCQDKLCKFSHFLDANPVAGSGFRYSTCQYCLPRGWVEIPFLKAALLLVLPVPWCMSSCSWVSFHGFKWPWSALALPSSEELVLCRRPCEFDFVNIYWTRPLAHSASHDRESYITDIHHDRVKHDHWT